MAEPIRFERRAKVALPPGTLAHAGVKRATTCRDAAAENLSQREIARDAARAKLADAECARREGRVMPGNVVDFERDFAATETVVRDARINLDKAEAGLAAAIAAAPTPEAVAEIDARHATRVAAWAQWIDDGARMLVDHEADRIRDSATLGHPSGLDGDLKRWLGVIVEVMHKLRPQAEAGVIKYAYWRG